MLNNILIALFNDIADLTEWRSDLERAWREEREAKSYAPNAPPISTHPLSTEGKHLGAGVRDGMFEHHQWHKLKAEPTNLNELLRTDLRATTLVGRDNELAMLNEWLDAPQDISVKCVVGRAGSGKTRLAIEFCEAADCSGWFATFIPSSTLQDFQVSHSLSNLAFPKPTLMVIDYAATSVAALKSWFFELAQRRSSAGQKLRILLLDRHADRQFGWWADLTRPGSNGHASASELIGAEIPYALAPLDAVRDRRALLAEVMFKAAPLFNPPRPPVALPISGAAAWFDQRLAEDKLDNEPLYLMMAGICAVESGLPTALAINRLTLAQRMASFEEERLKKFAKARGFNDEGKLLKHIAACVTLQNGCDPADLPTLVKEERCALDMTAPFDDEAIAEILCDFLPVVDQVEALRPDLIGESFCLPIIKGGQFRKDVTQQEIVLRCWQRDTAGTIDTLIRCACDLAEGSADHLSVRYLRTVVEANDEFMQLMAIADRIPEQTLALREFATEVHVSIIELLRVQAKAEPEIWSSMLASKLNNLATRLSNLGRREDALVAAEEAVALLRPLDAGQSDAFAPELARSLSTLATRLYYLGRPEDALAAANEASVLLHLLAAAQPDAFVLERARLCGNIAIYLSDLGQRDEALGAAKEAVALYRPLAAERPDAFVTELARSLSNVALQLGALGLRDEALAATEEAVALYRPLAATHPDAFLPDLARLLTNVAVQLSALNRRDEGLSAAEEAIALYRPLAVARPDVFVPDLALSLSNITDILSNLDQHDQALVAAEEAVALFRPLAAAQPDFFVAYLGRSLSNLANELSVLGQGDEALGATKEAVALYRPLMAARPDAFVPDLAQLLVNLAPQLSALGQWDEGLAAAEEAVALYHPLAVAWPDAFTPNLARSLSLLGDILKTGGRLVEAVAQHHMAVAALAPHLLAAPKVFSQEMRSYLDAYISRAEEAKIAPDGNLLKQVLDCLQNNLKAS